MNQCNLPLCACGCNQHVILPTATYLRGHHWKPTYESRFWSKVNKTENCWLWTGSLTTKGYGQYGLNNKRAHRLAWFFTYGTWPAQDGLDHLCRIRHCVNPAHLEEVSTSTNLHRGEPNWKKQKNKTHCVNGHLFDEQNTYWRPDRPTQRLCRQCGKESQRRRYALNRERRA